MSSLLSYASAPESVYASSASNGTSIASLALTVTNNTGADVALAYIDFTVPDVLTTAFGSIGASAPTGSGWSFGAKSQGSNVFRAYLTDPSAVFEDNASIVLTLNNIQVSEQVGQTAQITINQKDTSGTLTPAPLSVDIVAPVLGILTFQASPANINPGDTATLSWTTTEAATITLESPSWSVNHKDNGLSFNGSYAVNPILSTTYTLTITGLGAKVMKQVNVGVRNVDIISFTASAQGVIPGDPVELSWQTEFATHWQILRSTGDPIDLPNAKAADSYTVNPEYTTIYTLKAWDDNGNSAQSIPRTVTAYQVMINNFTALPTTVPKHGLCLLSWNVIHNAAPCLLQPGDIQVPPVGELYKVLTEDTTFTLVAPGYHNVNKEMTATVKVDASIQVTDVIVSSNGAPGAPGYPGSTGSPGAPGRQGGAGSDGGRGQDGMSASDLVFEPSDFGPLSVVTTGVPVYELSTEGGKGGDGGKGGNGGTGTPDGHGGTGGKGGNGGNGGALTFIFNPSAPKALYVFKNAGGAGGAGGAKGTGNPDGAKGPDGTPGDPGPPLVFQSAKAASDAEATSETL